MNKELRENYSSALSEYIEIKDLMSEREVDNFLKNKYGIFIFQLLTVCKRLPLENNEYYLTNKGVSNSILLNYYDVFNYFIDSNKININSLWHGETLLLEAVSQSKDRYVEILLEKGADWTIKDARGLCLKDRINYWRHNNYRNNKDMIRMLKLIENKQGAVK